MAQEGHEAGSARTGDTARAVVHLITVDVRRPLADGTGCARRRRRCSARPARRPPSSTRSPTPFAASAAGRAEGELERLRKENAALQRSCAPVSGPQPGGRARTPAQGRRARAVPHQAGPGDRHRARAGFRLDGDRRRRQPGRAEPDMTVINGDGLVGRVDLGRPHHLDRAARGRPQLRRRGAAGRSSMEIGIVSGRGGGPLTHAAARRPGHGQDGRRLVTFGSAGGTPFVPGVPVGEVALREADPGSADPHREGQALRRLHRDRPGRSRRRAAGPDPRERCAPPPTPAAAAPPRRGRTRRSRRPTPTPPPRPGAECAAPDPLPSP